MTDAQKSEISKRLLDLGITDVAGRFDLVDAVSSIVVEDRDAILKKFREFADAIWEEGKKAPTVGLEKALKGICTEIHRTCQIIAGEEPLPPAGARLES